VNGIGSSNELEQAFNNYRNSSKEEDLGWVMEKGKGLIYYYAKLFSAGSISDDLIQAGYEGLMKAVKRFDAGIASGFVTYASHCIMGEIRHYIRKENAYYKPGCLVNLKNKVKKLTAKRLKLTDELPELEEIAQFFKLEEESLLPVMRAGLVPLEKEKIRSLKYECFKLPIEDKLLVEQALGRLCELQQKVIRLLFFRGMTQVEAAKNLGINQRKVSRELHKGLDNMAKFIDEDK
jgi:RNA polymerase sigma-B factor